MHINAMHINATEVLSYKKDFFLVFQGTGNDEKEKKMDEQNACKCTYSKCKAMHIKKQSNVHKNECKCAAFALLHVHFQ